MRRARSCGPTSPRSPAGTTAARRRGLGSRLLDELETRARDHQVTTLRLDTRRDLVEARQLYAHHGYTEVRPFSRGPYSDHWFVKDGPFGT
jgi:L-amino acid N-acyltransferase YncA